MTERSITYEKWRDGLKRATGAKDISEKPSERWQSPLPYHPLDADQESKEAQASEQKTKKAKRSKQENKSTKRCSPRSACRY